MHGFNIAYFLASTCDRINHASADSLCLPILPKYVTTSFTHATYTTNTDTYSRNPHDITTQQCYLARKKVSSPRPNSSSSPAHSRLMDDLTNPPHFHPCQRRTSMDHHNLIFLLF